MRIGGGDQPSFKLAGQPIEVDGGEGDDRVQVRKGRAVLDDGVRAAQLALGPGDLVRLVKFNA